MIKRRYIWLILTLGLIPFALYPQSEGDRNPSLNSSLANVEFFLIKQDSQQRNTVLKEFTSLISTFETLRIKEKDDRDFLKKLFQKTHRKSLNRYSLYSDFGDTMLNGNYGCLSGTITYALLLSHFNFKYEVIELANHVYLQVHVGGSIVLFESTLAARGFMDRPADIKNALEHYSQRNTNSAVMAIAAANDLPNSEIQNRIGLTELAGLQLYNRGIQTYKNSDLISSLNFTLEAHDLYPSIRIKYLMQLLINEILYSKGLSEKVKQTALNNYVAHIRENRISQTK
uniref:hypothetical protein n=2 Tax=Roseivirga sp. TaxID=1964215 RepID=UPI00404832D4